MPYVDPNTISNPTTGQPILASWGDVVRDNLEFLINPPSCSVYHSTSQTLTTGVGASLSADSEHFDNDSMHSTSTNNTRITIQTPGRYLVFGAITFPNNTTAGRAIAFRVNNTTNYIATLVQAAGGATVTEITGVRAIVLGAGDYVECRAAQYSGGNLDVTLNEFAATFFTR